MIFANDPRRPGCLVRAGAQRAPGFGGLPAESWQHCQITQAKGKRRQVQYVEERVQLDGYDGAVRIRGSSLTSRSIEKFGRSFLERAIRETWRQLSNSTGASR